MCRELEGTIKIVATPISQYFSSSDYLLSLPIVLLTLFALGILLIDLILPADQVRLRLREISTEPQASAI